MCADELVPAAAILDTVAALVDKSLVVREPEALGQARFRMLDTVREYAAEKLALAGEATAAPAPVPRPHRSPSPSGTSPWAWRWCPRPGRTGSTCSAGTTWTRATSGWCSAECLAEADVATGLRICTAIRPCMLVRGEFALGCEWVDAFLALPQAAEVDPRIRGQALIGRAQLSMSGDPAGASRRPGPALTCAARPGTSSGRRPGSTC